MTIRSEEISTLIKQQIENYQAEVEIWTWVPSSK